MTTVNVTRGDTTIVRIITAGPQGPAGGGGGAGTDLSYDAATRLLSSSTGTDVTLPVATTALAGLESAADKTKLDSITVDSATLVRKYVRNNSGVTIPKGAAVYQTGSSGTTLTVALADASAEATASQTLGLAQETIANNANGYIVAVGLLDGVNTAALTEGQIIWLSETTGEVTSTRPTQPAHGVVCGYCVKQAAGAAGILYVKIDNGLELEELHDVLITAPVTGQVLRRAADGLWKNAALTASDVSGVATSGAITGSGLTMATARLLGRSTAATGAVEEIVIGSGLSLSGGTLTATGGGGGGSGTVTSVGLSLPSIFTVSGSPVTSSGTLTGDLATQSANAVFAGPTTGAAAQPTFRALVTTDLPATGAFSVLSASLQLTLPNGAAGTPAVRDLYAVANTLRYRDSTNTERLLLNATDNLANLSNTATARSNIGAAASGAIGSSGLTMATARLLGRTTASTGAPEEITVGSGLSLSGGTLTATGGGGGTSFAGYAVGNWIQPVIGNLSNITSSVASTIYLYPFVVNRSITVSDLGARVTTGAVSAQFQLAIYASSSGLPTGTPLGNTGNLPGDAATHVSGLVTPFNLSAGQLYWAAFNCSIAITMQQLVSASTYFSSVVGSPSLQDVTSNAQSSGFIRAINQAYGTWPDLTSATTTVQQGSTGMRGACCFLKVSALL